MTLAPVIARSRASMSTDPQVDQNWLRATAAAALGKALLAGELDECVAICRRIEIVSDDARVSARARRLRLDALEALLEEELGRKREADV